MTPSIVTVADLKRYPTSDNGRGEWIPVRPDGYRGWKILTRIKIAYLVFIGELDALKWR